MFVIGVSSPYLKQNTNLCLKINNMNKVQHLSKYHNINISLFNKSNIENAWIASIIHV